MMKQLFWLLLTILMYVAALRLHRKYQGVLTQPILVCSFGIMVLLVALRIPYDEYAVNTSLLSFLVGPATVALAVPLYRHARVIRNSLLPALLTIVAGAFTGLLSPLLLVSLLRGSDTLGLTMAPKSATTPIAMELAASIGGVPELTAVFTVLTGIVGALIGPRLARFLGLDDPGAIGLVVGISGHAIGTAEMLRRSALKGAFSGFGMAATGITTVVLSLLIFK